MDSEKLIAGLSKEAYGSDVEELLLEAATALSTLQTENEKLRAELEQSSAEITRLKYYEDKCHDCPIVCAKTEIIKAHEELETVKAELEQVKRERDAAVSWAQKFTESIDRPCAACKHNTGDYVCTAICGNCGPMGTESCKWEFDFSGELKED